MMLSDLENYVFQTCNFLVNFVLQMLTFAFELHYYPIFISSHSRPSNNSCAQSLRLLRPRTLCAVCLRFVREIRLVVCIRSKLISDVSPRASENLAQMTSTLLAFARDWKVYCASHESDICSQVIFHARTIFWYILILRAIRVFMRKVSRVSFVDGLSILVLR